MAQLEDLLSEIDDPQLRASIEREVRQLKQRTRFGLVFEKHLPESVLLAAESGLRVGDEVRLRTEPQDRRRLLVTGREGDRATLSDRDGEEQVALIADLLVFKPFDEAVYPTLAPLGRLERGGDRAPHLAIEGENYHALQILRFTHPRSFDCIYIDPPYNTGARDWKYNNDFVDDQDDYRSSKWLSFMDKRLKLAKELLKPDGVLIITIDENELHHLGVLLERNDLFSNAIRQLVSIVINPSGAAGEGLSRVEEYAIFCFLGAARPVAVGDDMLIDSTSNAETASHGVRWERLMRGGNAWYRDSRPNLCYPVLLSEDRTRIIRAGGPLEGEEADRPEHIDGHPVAWPLRRDGKLGIWRVQASRLNWLVEHGYAYISTQQAGRAPTLRYLLEGTVSAIEAGAVEVTGRGERGQVLVRPAETTKTAKTIWSRGRHIAGGAGGTQLLNALLGERNIFSFPKSIYAVRDCLDVAIGDRRDALILDFFAGSATTLHAACLMNTADGGTRRCVVVTNNEVNEERARQLNGEGLFVGDADFERHGIYQAAARPRIEAAITGRRPDGEPAAGSYLDGAPIASGFEENVEFARIEHLHADQIELGTGLAALGPLLWLKAGGRGAMPGALPAAEPFAVYGDAGYAVLIDDSAFTGLLEAIVRTDGVEHVFIITDYDDAFAAMTSALSGRTTMMLPRDYLRWYGRNTGAQR